MVDFDSYIFGGSPVNSSGEVESSTSNSLYWGNIDNTKSPYVTGATIIGQTLYTAGGDNSSYGAIWACSLPLSINSNGEQTTCYQNTIQPSTAEGLAGTTINVPN